jgi:hypothetical protein
VEVGSPQKWRVDHGAALPVVFCKAAVWCGVWRLDLLGEV